MATLAQDLSPAADAALTRAVTLPKARIGLIIPSSNRMSEPQFQHLAPDGLAVNVTRLQMTGPWKKPVPELMGDIARAASALADSQVDLIVFHCTGTSMEDGPEGDRKIVEMIAKETGTAALSTGQAVVEALRALALKRLVVVSPYVQATNDHERDYLTALGFEVLHDVALGLGGGNSYIQVPPERWIEIVRANTRPNADGYFLSCTNTTQIGAIATLERELGKPMVNSNQATLWACLKRLSGKLGPVQANKSLGRLFGVS
jgi:maleate cis-trans isomerase